MGGAALLSHSLLRREFLRLGSLALGGLALPDLLRARAATASVAAPPDTTVILFWMWGGPSQLETWDCKPDAPSEYRGPLKPIHTTVPGLDVCEVFPLQAKLGHRISLVRSLHHKMSSHNDGSIELLTGKTPAKDFKPYSLWWSRYADAPDVHPTWSKYWLWQYTDDHNGPKPHDVPGLGFCDCSTFDGDAFSLITSWTS